MEYLSVVQIAEKWNISPRSVRNYCAEGRIPGAFLTGKTWAIPADAARPVRQKRSDAAPQTLLDILKAEKAARQTGGIYHRIQIDLTYNSNHIEGSCLTHDQTRYIYETSTIGITDGSVNVDDIIETSNHFRCVDLIIDHAGSRLSDRFIKNLHFTLKTGTSDSRQDWLSVGDYKRLPNEVGGHPTTSPETVSARMSELLEEYAAVQEKTLEELIDFHVRFERIHPFQDGNGRVGRLILFKECLRWNIVPFIIEDDLKLFYYRGLNEWDRERGFLTDTILTAQDRFKEHLDYFRIGH